MANEIGETEKPREVPISSTSHNETKLSDENFIKTPKYHVGEDLADKIKSKASGSGKFLPLPKFDPAKKLVFLHIGKAGGTSFDKAMTTLLVHNRNQEKFFKYL